MVFNSHLPRVSRQEMRTGVKRLGVILHLFGLGQDGVDIWDGVILQATAMIGQNHFKWVHFGNKSCCTMFICPDTETLTCSNLMFTVKSPARRLSRMSLKNVRKKKQNIIHIKRGANAFAKPKLTIWKAYISIAQQTRMRKWNLSWSENRESQIRITSGRRNSWDSNKVSQRNVKYCGLMFCSSCDGRKNEKMLNKQWPAD